MADTQTQDATDEPYRLAGPEAMDAWRKGADATADKSSDIASLAGPSDKSAIADLVNVQKRKMAADSAIMSEADKRLARDQARMDQAFAAEGHAASEQLKPWDAEKEHKRFESNPIEGFGSVGAIFAMVASAFTKAPMENAIMGMAGALNSIKEGNEAAYQRAYDSFKENTKLALERFKTQHELYQDALGMMDHDQTAANAKLHNAAVRFGDQQTLMLLEHGMSKELFELQDARTRSAEQLQEYADKTNLRTVQRAAVNAVKMSPPQTGDPVQDKMMLAAQVQRIYDGGGKYGTAEQEAVGRYMQANMNKSPQELADGLAKIHEQFSPKAVNTEGYRAWLRDYVESHNGQYPSAEDDARKMQEFGLTGGVRGGAGGASQSTQARKTQAIKEIQDKNPGMSLAEAERKFNETVQIPSAHDKHSDDIQYAKAERMETALDEMEDLLQKHKFITGIGGSLSRPIEAVSNVLGSNETDRKQFQRIATELKEWGQSVVNDRSGRPLSSEAHDAAVIFAGLNPGDTGPNTLRAIVELRPVLRRIKSDIKARGEGRGPVSGGGETPPASEGSKESAPADQPWLKDPVKPNG